MEHFSQAGAGRHLSPKSLGLILGGIVLLILLGSSVFIVGQAERAVITRFGRFVEVREPGLHFKLPFIEKQQIVNTQEERSEEFGIRVASSGANPVGNSEEATMLTGDLNILEIGWTIQYRVEDPRAWLFNMNIPDRIPTIRDVSRSVMNQLIGDRALMGVMVTEGRGAINVEAMQMMNERFRSYDLGIDVVRVTVGTIVPPADVRSAFAKVIQANQERSTLVSEGMRAYNQAIPRAKGEADRTIQVAQGYAAERVNMARGDVSRFNAMLTEYQAAPAVTRQRLYYEMMEEVLGNPDSKTLVDHNLDNFLPIQSIGQR